MDATGTAAAAAASFNSTPAPAQAVRSLKLRLAPPQLSAVATAPATPPLVSSAQLAGSHASANSAPHAAKQVSSWLRCASRAFAIATCTPRPTSAGRRPGSIARLRSSPQASLAAICRSSSVTGLAAAGVDGSSAPVSAVPLALHTVGAACRRHSNASGTAGAPPSPAMSEARQAGTAAMLRRAAHAATAACKSSAAASTWAILLMCRCASAWAADQACTRCAMIDGAQPAKHEAARREGGTVACVRSQRRVDKAVGACMQHGCLGCIVMLSHGFQHAQAYQPHWRWQQRCRHDSGVTWPARPRRRRQLESRWRVMEAGRPGSEHTSWQAHR